MLLFCDNIDRRTNTRVNDCCDARKGDSILEKPEL